MKPILFNTQMVQAILDGRKTTTRRIIKDNQCFQGQLEKRRISPNEFLTSGFCKNNWDDKTKIEQNFRRPYDVGDILYVRETWMISNPRGDFARNDLSAEYYYKAGFAHGKRVPISYEQQKNLGVWKPSIHMPKKAARIFLRVTDVRVERLQNMDFKDFMSEGIEVDDVKKALYESGVDVEETRGLDEEVEAFANLWDSTIKKDQIDLYGWNVNPWVWVIEFERIKKSEVEQ